MPVRDPWEALGRLGPRRIVLAVTSGASLVAHAAMLVGAILLVVLRLPAPQGDSAPELVDVDVVQEPPKAEEPKAAPPEPDPPEKPEPDPAPKDKAPPPPPDPAEPKDAKAKDPYGDDPPPIAAEAPDILHQADDGDLTAWTMVHKEGSKNTGGGYTSGEGTAKHPVRDPRASSKGREGGHGDHGDGEPGAKRVDKSRPAMPVNRNLSDCPFPPQADVAQVDRAVVDVTVSVDANGRPTSAAVSSDPGNGFGAQARRCALSMRYDPAHGPDGESIPGSTPTLRFRFNR